MELYNKDTTYFFALTLIGDCFYNLGDYENAIFYFDKAMARNFIDYDAHWFKADALKNLGDMDGALREITIAHLLNVNHESLNMVLRRYREIIGRPWKEMNFEPWYELEISGDSVFVKADPGWLGYASVKALWKYEPGYAESMIGEDYKSLMEI
jgi:tetratricopeptide (TPR) repeat protein